LLFFTRLKISTCDVIIPVSVVDGIYRHQIQKRGKNMKIKRIQEKRHSFLCALLSFMLMVTLAGFASVAGATYSIPADRSVNWAGHVGVLGDIPDRTTVYRTLSPSGSGDASAIQTAINNCPSGQVVKLNAGTFTVSSPITLKSGVTLRGAGLGATTIKGASGMSGAYVVGITNGGSASGTSISISGGFKKGSTSITTASAHGWSAGDIILIDQLNNKLDNPPVTNVGYRGVACTWCGRSSGTRSIGQLVRVVAVPSSTTATLEIPLSWNYDASRSPQGTKMNGLVKDAGVEDLTIDNSLSGTSAQSDNGGTIVLRGTSNCWLLRVEAIGSYMTMLRIHGAYRNTIRGCKFHEGTPALPIDGPQYNTSRAYGIWFNPYASANLLENNQLYHLGAGIMMNGAVSGNVVAYNYITTMYLYNNTNYNLYDVTFHGPHPVMNLFEGNYSEGRFVADNVFGSSSHNTFFRNRQFLSAGKNGAPWNYDIQYNASYYNIVGNVIGTLGHETTYELNNVTLSGQKSIFRFGYTSDGDKDPSGNNSQCNATTLRHANWDSATNGVVWNSSADRVLPASLYLNGKPNWWGTLQWPAIGPDVSPMYPPIPGAGKGTPWDSKAALSPPSNLKVQ
jgi:hypothetical protein